MPNLPVLAALRLLSALRVLRSSVSPVLIPSCLELSRRSRIPCLFYRFHTPVIPQFVSHLFSGDYTLRPEGGVPPLTTARRLVQLRGVR